MKNIFLILAFLLITSTAQSKPSRSSTSDSTSRDDGNDRTPISIAVNSTTAVSPYSNIGFGEGEDAQIRNFRLAIIQNPSSVDVLIGTFTGFTAASPYWFVPGSSGSWTTFNSATFYMLVVPDGSTVTVRGLVEKQK